MSDLLFVYGALRRGASNDWRMKHARFVGAAEVLGTLVKIDWYPGLVLEGETPVKGEVYEVPAKVFGELDEFEGITAEDDREGEYRRIQVEIPLGGESTKVWIYEWVRGIENYEVVGSGDWLEPGL